MLRIRVVFGYLLLFNSCRPTVAECEPDHHANCTALAARGDCIDNETMDFMQCHCPTSCKTISSCNETLGDLNCTCASYAESSRCDNEIQPVCAYSCALRQNITCDYEDLPQFENAGVYPVQFVYRYLEDVEYYCDACFINNGGHNPFAKHICQNDGSWLRHGKHQVPHCVKKCKNQVQKNCEESERFYCYSDNDEDLYTIWKYCPALCSVPAHCNIGEGETHCNCGVYVKKGYCESNTTIHDVICPVSCNRRDAITCVEPETFPHATPSEDRRYFATLNYTCDAGYQNEGGPGTRYCTLNTTWVHKDVNNPDCKPIPKVHSTTFSSFVKLTFPETTLEMKYVSDVPAESVISCAMMCHSDETCTHFSFTEPRDCTLYDIYGSDLETISTFDLWEVDI